MLRLSPRSGDTLLSLESYESRDTSEDRLRFLSASGSLSCGVGDRERLEDLSLSLRLGDLEALGDLSICPRIGDLDILRYLFLPLSTGERDILSDRSLCRKGDFDALLDLLVPFSTLAGRLGDGDRDWLVDIVETEAEETEKADRILFPLCPSASSSSICLSRFLPLSASILASCSSATPFLKIAHIISNPKL